METLGSPQATMEILRRYDFRGQKKYGQNFLIDSRILYETAQAADITDKDFVIEIGPGIGTMTQVLAQRAREVVTIEIDGRLLPILKETLEGFENVTVIHSDILKVDLAALIEEKNQGRPVKVVANLPYYITTSVTEKLLEERLPIESITVMIQKEAADRMTAKQGTEEYGILSLIVQYFAGVRIAVQVPRDSFLPKPGVDSVVACLTCRDDPSVSCRDEALMFRIIRAAFGQRRKTLLNGLSNSPAVPFEKEQIARALTELGWDPAVRGEALSIGQFAQLTDILSEMK